jgi:hypothetical protein
MRIPGIEPPQLRTLTQRKDGPAWAKQHAARAASSVVLEYDLNLVPETRGLPDRLRQLREVVKDALAKVDPGGVVVAIARACDSGQELAELMVKQGVPPHDLGISNVVNSEIACLRPQSAVFLASIRTYRGNLESADPIAFARNVRKSPVEPDARLSLPESFSTRILDVGLIWQKAQ